MKKILFVLVAIFSLGVLSVKADNDRIIWENTLTEMISCLELMDEENAEKFLGIAANDYSVESYDKVTNLMEESKNRFFELFSKHFYSLWD